MKNNYNNFHILKTIEADASVTQRKLSSQMKLNVASVNFALKNLIRKGYVTKVGENRRRTKYYITPDGIREKTQMAYKFFSEDLIYYKEIKNDIEARIIKATNGLVTNIAIYGANEFSETTYSVVLKIGLNFLGFFLEGSRITDKKILGYNIQDLKLLKTNQKCLLLLTENLSSNKMNDIETMNIDTLSLVVK